MVTANNRARTAKEWTRSIITGRRPDKVLSQSFHPGSTQRNDLRPRCMISAEIIKRRGP